MFFKVFFLFVVPLVFQFGTKFTDFNVIAALAYISGLVQFVRHLKLHSGHTYIKQPGSVASSQAGEPNLYQRQGRGDVISLATPPNLALVF